MRQLQLQRRYFVTCSAGVQPIGRRLSPWPRNFNLWPNSHSLPRYDVQLSPPL